MTRLGQRRRMEGRGRENWRYAADEASILIREPVPEHGPVWAHVAAGTPVENRRRLRPVTHSQQLNGAAGRAGSNSGPSYSWPSPERRAQRQRCPALGAPAPRSVLARVPGARWPSGTRPAVEARHGDRSRTGDGMGRERGWARRGWKAASAIPEAAALYAVLLSCQGVGPNQKIQCNIPTPP